MKTLTVEEAGAGLGQWVERALAGEKIQISQGDSIIELRPASAVTPDESETLPPLEALRRLQEESSVTPEQAERYRREVRKERLAAEARCPA